MDSFDISNTFDIDHQLHEVEALMATIIDSGDSDSGDGDSGDGDSGDGDSGDGDSGDGDSGDGDSGDGLGKDLANHSGLGSSRDNIVNKLAHQHLGTGGKRLRARLALEVGKALQGAVEGVEATNKSIPDADFQCWAAACELLHNATLIHDDLQDGDTMRRGEPAMWISFGVEQAINGGDLLFVLPFEAVARIYGTEATTVVSLSRLLSKGAAQVIRGQALELDNKLNAKLDEGNYLKAITGKTSALFSLPAYGSILLATGQTEVACEELVAPFKKLGVLFQIQDDLLDVFGDKGRGERGNDLREGKVSALVVAHVRIHPDDEQELIKFLQTSRSRVEKHHIDTWTMRFENHGAKQAVVEQLIALRQEIVTLGSAQHYPQTLAKVLLDLVQRILGPVQNIIAES